MDSDTGYIYKCTAVNDNANGISYTWKILGDEAYTAQTLTEEQKAQARENIGAADANVIGDIETALDGIIAIQNELIGGDGA
jgi:hypothetical protein